jgi:hypothetical protein
LIREEIKKLVERLADCRIASSRKTLVIATITRVFGYFVDCSVGLTAVFYGFSFLRCHQVN